MDEMQCRGHINYFRYICLSSHFYPDSKVHGVNMGPTWVLSAPDGPHVGSMNLAIRIGFLSYHMTNMNCNNFLWSKMDPTQCCVKQVVVPPSQSIRDIRYPLPVSCLWEQLAKLPGASEILGTMPLTQSTSAPIKLTCWYPYALA